MIRLSDVRCTHRAPREKHCLTFENFRFWRRSKLECVGYMKHSKVCQLPTPRICSSRWGDIIFLRGIYETGFYPDDLQRILPKEFLTTARSYIGKLRHWSASCQRRTQCAAIHRRQLPRRDDVQGWQKRSPHQVRPERRTKISQEPTLCKQKLLSTRKISYLGSFKSANNKVQRVRIWSRFGIFRSDSSRRDNAFLRMFSFRSQIRWPSEIQLRR